MTETTSPSTDSQNDTPQSSTPNGRKPRLVILGAGPIGLEAALLANELGFDTKVFEAGPSVATHIRRWKHVRMFAPWSFNTTKRGLEAVGCTNSTADISLMQSDLEMPTGAQFIQKYLEPIGQLLTKRNILYLNSHVDHISRPDLRKNQAVGKRAQSEGFVLLVKDLTGSEEYHYADVVIDCSGCYWSVLHAGPGGLPPLGYDHLSRPFEHEIPDLESLHRARFLSAEAVLVVGSGTSATTTIRNLHEFNESERADKPLKITWFVSSETPLIPIENDRLQGRRQLAEFSIQAAQGKIPNITPVINTAMISVKEVVRDVFPPHKRTAYIVEYENPSNRAETFWQTFDEVILHTGFVPDLSITRELQIHYCYASEGPMALAVNLQQPEDGSPGDCLAQPAPGFESLKTSEPNFFILGAKSYGRNSSFLIRTGHEQVNLLFDHLKTLRF